MAEEESNFLSRWSRRKVAVREGLPVAEPVVPPPVPAPAAVALVGTVPSVAEAEPETPAAPPLPTLADVSALTIDSDYTRFVAQGVTPEVKNAALKKLFTDPHYNIMDGLDTYIDDYGKPDPLPPGMLRQMVQSRMLGLFDEEDAADAAAAAQAAAGEEALHKTPPDENTDLQLQPDDDAGRASAAPGAEQDPGRQH